MTGRSPVVRGMMWMTLTGFIFVLLNATMKKLAHQLDPWLVGFLRYFIGSLVILGPALRLGSRAFLSSAPGLQFVRGLFHAGGMMLWFAALPFITLPELTAIGFTAPIFICVGATLFLGERMSAARWAAVLIGFGGVLLIVRPWAAGGFSGISRGVLLMLASAPAFAGSFLIAKKLTRHDPSEVVVLWQHLWVSIVLAGFAYSLWTPPSAVQWALLVACGFLGTAGHYCMTRAFRVADISATQPIKFLELVWASVLGVLLFDTLPTGATIAGGLVILSSTLLIARHEARAAAK